MLSERFFFQCAREHRRTGTSWVPALRRLHLLYLEMSGDPMPNNCELAAMWICDESSVRRQRAKLAEESA